MYYNWKYNSVVQNFNKCISEGLMHVAARYRGTLGPKFTKFGEKCQLA